MRRGAFFLAILFAVTAPSVADAKKHRTRAHLTPAVAANPNEAGGRLVANGLTAFFLTPMQSMTASSAPAPAVVKRHHKRM